jgi:structural maintenance of chromosome 3 (chondroitin sulfate proteoglycan 6)
VFGKTYICRDLDVATKISAQYNLNCITLEGDQVNKSGGITGGYYDRRASRLAAMASIKEHQKQIDSLNKDLLKVRTAAQKVREEG